MSTQVALTTIAICQIILTVAIALAAIGLVIAVFMIKNMISSKIDDVLSRVQPVVDQAKNIAEQARETAESVSAKVDSIMEKAESTAGRVTERVEAVSERVEGAVSPQVVTIAGIVGTAAKCAQIYSDIMKARRGNGSDTCAKPPES